MISIDKLKVIAKAKFSDKSKLGDWYKDRLDICASCPLNSKNREKLSPTHKAMVIANFGKPTCVACGCEIAAKASVREEKCGLIYMDQPPIWDSLPPIEQEEVNDLVVQNLNSDKATLKRALNQLEINYGVVPGGFDSELRLEIESKKGPITDLKVKAACGCTTVGGKTENGKAYVDLSYDTVGRRGAVTKSVNIQIMTAEQKRPSILLGKLVINVNHNL